MSDAVPFFTIITATYNAAATLPRLLESLAGQTYRGFELIIQDGASTDGTVAAAESHRDRLPSLSLASEPDNGIYDAWNKALTRMRGEWALFLGADDELADTAALATARKKVKLVMPDIVFAAASLQKINPNGTIRNVLRPEKLTAAMSSLRQGYMPVPHPALLHRRSLFTSDYRFDASFAIAGDDDFLCRTWTPEKTAILNMVLTRMHDGGVSVNPFFALAKRKEVLRIVRKYYPQNVSFALHILPVLKGYPLQAICKIFGKKYAPGVLDALRTLRGLPPVWTRYGKDKP